MVVALSLGLLIPTFNSIIGGASTQGDHQSNRQQRRLVMVYVVILLVLLSAEWAMVFKPT